MNATRLANNSMPRFEGEEMTGYDPFDYVLTGAFRDDGRVQEQIQKRQKKAGPSELGMTPNSKADSKANSKDSDEGAASSAPTLHTTPIRRLAFPGGCA
jgi:hypothetical protein